MASDPPRDEKALRPRTVPIARLAALVALIRVNEARARASDRDAKDNPEPVRSMPQQRVSAA
ncbi:hypothetical protein Kisp01_69710 [Kineosporia sp. NBRC 101677]|nr:hypothetical protein Kisp01_69710 [Kineosporia sp. NBRC 101677]